MVAQLEAISSPDGYDTAISESLLAKYAADKDAYIARLEAKLGLATGALPPAAWHSDPTAAALPGG